VAFIFLAKRHSINENDYSYNKVLDDDCVAINENDQRFDDDYVAIKENDQMLTLADILRMRIVCEAICNNSNVDCYDNTYIRTIIRFGEVIAMF